MRKAYKEEYIDLDLLFKIINKDPDVIYTGVSGRTKIKFECTKCHKEFTKSYDAFRNSHFQMLCSVCLHEQTCIEKYGTTSYSKTDEYKSRCIETCMKTHGVEYPMQSKEVKAKSIKTSHERYGVDYYNQTEECRDRMK